MTSPRYVVIAGNIATGKSTLARLLWSKLGWRTYIEQAEQNPYLEQYYKDRARWALQSQLWFLARKARILNEIDSHSKPSILDRSLAEDKLFASLVLDQDVFPLYSDLYDLVESSITPPSYLIYLTCPLNEIRRRIRQRGLLIEQSIHIKLLEELQAAYTSWIKAWDSCPVLSVDTGKLDFASNPECVAQIVREVRRFPASIVGQ